MPTSTSTNNVKNVYTSCCAIHSTLAYRGDGWFGRLLLGALEARQRKCIIRSNVVCWLWWQQRVQNAIARVVTPTRKRDRVTLILKRLYWLPVPQRMTYKTATFVYSMRRNRELDYLFFLLEDYIPRRSSSIRCLNAPRTKLKTGNGFRHRRTAYVECIATGNY